MTDRANGLRFDIYERVHLPDDVAAIEELEEIELVPNMQALNQADQLLLRGHLLLTGLYRSSEGNGESARLEHTIPVEISLPPSRVQQVEDLAVEIDNFDVDLLSTRSLNVTGVLALRGLQTETAQPPIWQDDSFTVVHQARTDRSEPNAETASYEEAESPDLAAIQADSPLSGDADELANVGHSDDEALVEAQAVREPTSDIEEQAEPSTEQESLQWSSDVGWGDITERKPEDEDGLVPEFAKSDAQGKPEVKVALGTKSSYAQDGQAPGVDWLSKLGDKRSEIQFGEDQPVLKAEDETAGDSSAALSASTGDELEWKRLFLSAEADPDPFSKIRLCIVQREDTLEGIAARYNVQPRELQLRNQLSDPYLSEGQILYIP